MATKRKRQQRKPFQSWGNLALANESSDVPQYPKVHNLCLVPVSVKEKSDEESEIDSLGPVRGMMMGIGLSIVLWVGIILITSWIL